jgi:leucyl aminopeptidase (aminopeptidase T)
MNDYVRRLAVLAVEVGANVAPGQDVVVLVHDVEHAPLAREVADAAVVSCPKQLIQPAAASSKAQQKIVK